MRRIQRCQAIPRLLPERLSRARSLPLSLTLTDDWDRDFLSYPRPEDTLLPAVPRLSEQWRSLALEGSYWDDLFESGPLSGKVPLLEGLFVSGSAAVILDEAPKLRVLSLDSCYPKIQVPWHQLTTLDASFTLSLDDEIFASPCIQLPTRPPPASYPPNL
ncbi:hypothetical protein C8F04DRAFT_474562 [Mycena alexandri]|uniref:Uncharacterized protein n=1 Tax=Mycena alexandri TaxID=1745969 RepID=A0AAD6T3F2_9AGAR|nr:hypothetical protein C8F04DRAFT_474562 [Mycena alexandri]